MMIDNKRFGLNNKPISIKQITMPFLVVITALFAVLITVEFIATSLWERLNHDITRYSICIKCADEFRFGSEKLIDESHAFIAGQGISHFENFVQEINAGGMRQRALSVLKNSGVEESTVAILEKGYDDSKLLASKEMMAMALAAKSDVYKAKEIPPALANYEIPSKYNGLSSAELLYVATEMVYNNEYNNLENEISSDILQYSDMAESSYKVRWSKENSLLNNLRCVRNICYIVLFLLIFAFAVVFSRTIYISAVKMMEAIKKDEPIKLSPIKCYRYLGEAYNSLRENLHKEVELLSLANDEISIRMKKTGKYVVTYDLIQKTMTVSEEVAKRTNLPTVITDMPQSILTYILPFLNEADGEAIKQFFDDIINGKHEGEIEVKITGRSKKVEWERYTYHTIFNENNKPIKSLLLLEEITSEKVQKNLYEQYMISFENRVLNSKGVFVWLDITENKLIRIRQYVESNYREKLANDLAELFSQFDAFKFKTINEETLSQVYNQETLLRQYNAGNHDLLSHWKGTKPNGKQVELEMLTNLVSNPTNGHIEAAIQIYEQSRANEVKGEAIKNVLFIQNPGPQREALVTALKPYFNIITADSGNEGKIALTLHKNLHIILLDLSLKDEDSFMFIRDSQKDRGIIPLLALSDGTIAQELAALEAGVADLQSKPINTTLIQHRITNILSKQEMLLELKNDLSLRDEVTGLFRFRTFLSLASEMLQTSTDNEFAVVCLDIDEFKMINARYGIARGDKLLIQLGEILKFLTEDSVSFTTRSRAGRFYAFIPNDKELIERLYRVINETNFGFTSALVVWMGVYVISDHGETIRLIINKALVAMETAKSNKINLISWFDETMHTEMVLRRKVIEDLPKAMNEEQIVPYFQPKYNYVKKCFCGAEALVRWHHPTLGFLAPNKFISILEEEGLICDLDLYILEKVCACQRRWKESGIRNWRVSVNFSQMDFAAPNFIEKVFNIIDRYNLTGNDIRFEVTETAYINDYNKLNEFVDTVHEKGFFIDIDDFGSGYASMNMLDQINADALKFQISMVHQRGNKKNEHILSALIRMAGWLNMQVLGEGIETEQQAEYLYNLGCVYMQGYLFSEPLPAVSYEALLTSKDNVEFPEEIVHSEHGISLANTTTMSVDDIPSFLRSVGQIFPLVVAQNYTKNEYYIVEYDSFNNKDAKSKGTYVELISVTANSFHPSDKESFVATFKLENVVHLFEDGQTHLSHIGRQMGEDGIYHWVRTKVLSYRDSNGDIKGYTLSRVVDDEFKEKEQSEFNSKIISSMASEFHCVYEIDLITKTLREITAPPYVREYIPAISNIKKALSEWSKHELSKEDYKNFFDFWNFDNISERFDSNENLSITLQTKTSRWEKISLSVLDRDDSGKVTKILWFSQKIGRIKSKEREANTSKLAVAENFDIAYQVDLQKNICTEIKGDERLRKTIPTESTVTEVIHTFITQGVSENYQEQMLSFTDLETLDERLRGRLSLSIDYYGRLFTWLRAYIVPTAYSSSGKVKQLIFGVQHIEKEKLAEIDGMTGLLNSSTSQAKISKEIRSSDAVGAALLVLDVDDLKSINDNKGHKAGTDVICGVAECLKARFRSTDIIGRYGGDEFVVFVSGYSNREEQLKEKIYGLLTEISSKSFVCNCDCKVTCTVGVAMANGHTNDFESLFNKADEALYAAKKAGKNTVIFYNETNSET